MMTSFNRIHHSLKWGGDLLLFEKVRADDVRFEGFLAIK